MLSATWLLHPLCPERRGHTQMGPCWASESEHQTAAQWTPFEMWRQRPSCFQHCRLANSLPRWFNTFKAVRGQNFWSVWCFECGVSACPPCWPNPTFACVAICAPALCNSPWWTARRQTALAALDSSQTTKESCRLLATSPHPGPSQSIQIYPDPRFKVWERWVVGFNLGIWIVQHLVIDIDPQATRPLRTLKLWPKTCWSLASSWSWWHRCFLGGLVLAP